MTYKTVKDYFERSRLGLRACLCYEVSDREGESKCRAAIQENLSFMREAARRTDGMRRGMMGMHAGFTLSDKTLEDLGLSSTSRAISLTRGSG